MLHLARGIRPLRRKAHPMSTDLSHVAPEPTPPTSTARARRAFATLSVVALGAGGLLTACSTDDLADRVTEKVAESGGEDVDVSVDSESGEYSIESADGSTKMQVGSAELPDDWPAEIPLPEDYTLTAAMSTASSGSPGFNIGGSLPEDADALAVFDEITAAFVADGWTEQQKGTSTFEGGSTSSASYDNGTWQAVVGVSAPTEDEAAYFSYTVVASSEG
jgi:hypothetical protein